MRSFLRVTFALALVASACTDDARPTSESFAPPPNDVPNEQDPPNDPPSTPPSTAKPPGAPSSVEASAVPLAVTVSTFAGSGTLGYADGAADKAAFRYPSAVAIGQDGTLYIADRNGQRIRTITSAGAVATLAGSGSEGFVNGSKSQASFRYPQGLGVDPSGNVFVVDYGNHVVRKITASGDVTTFAGTGAIGRDDGAAGAATFAWPGAITVDPSGNLFVADTHYHLVRSITKAGAVTTLAGSGGEGFADGTGKAASFHTPESIAVDNAGNVYVADAENHRVRKVTSAGVVTTLAGSGKAAFADGTGAAASFNFPTGIAVDAAGVVYVAECSNHRIRRVTATGHVSTLAGTGSEGFADGAGASAKLACPQGIAIDGTGNLYIADTLNNRVRKLVSTGVGELVVSWKASSTADAYEASARATGQTTQVCKATSSTSCTIRGLTSGVAYRVSVIATNKAGASAASSDVTSTPN